MSMSQVAFLYGPGKKLSAQFGVDVSSLSSTDIGVAPLLAKTESIFQLHLGINFDSPNPHRRIQEPLTVSLNRRFRETGVESVLASMSETFPLLRCLDQITTPVQSGSSSTVHVTVRSPTVFQFHYPLLRARFRLSTRAQGNSTVWLLEDAQQSPSANPSQISTTVREKIYNSRGHGWQGLGDGAFSSLARVGSLLEEFHSCLGECPPVAIQEEKGAPGQAGTANPRPQEGPRAPVTPQPPAGMSAKANVITID